MSSLGRRRHTGLERSRRSRPSGEISKPRGCEDVCTRDHAGALRTEVSEFTAAMKQPGSDVLRFLQDGAEAFSEKRGRRELNQVFETIDLAFIFERASLVYLLAKVCSILTALTRIMKFHLLIHFFSLLPSSGGRTSGLLKTK